MLEIFKKEFNKWTSIINITQLWISYCKVSINPKENKFTEFKDKLLSLKITSAKWFDKPELSFLTCHKNGIISFWNVSPSKKMLKMSVKFCINSYKTPCALDLISSFDVKYNILIVGSVTGCLKGLSIDFMTGQIIEDFSLWKNEDLIATNSILSKKIKDNILLFAFKRHILLIFNLFITTCNKVDILKTNWVDFPSAFSSINEWNNNLIIGLQNHNIYSFNIKDSNLNYELHLIDMGIKEKQKNSNHCYGLAMSKNKAIWIMVSSPKLNYDSLKEITHLSVYTTEMKQFRSVSDCTSCGLIEKISKRYTTTKLYEISDFLELKRLELLYDESKFKPSYECSQDLPLLDLKLLLWEAKLKQFCHSSESFTKISDLEYLIAKKQAIDTVIQFQKHEVLSEIEEKCLKMNSKFLSKEENK